MNVAIPTVIAIAPDDAVWHIIGLAWDTPSVCGKLPGDVVMGSRWKYYYDQPLCDQCKIELAKRRLCKVD